MGLDQFGIIDGDEVCSWRKHGRLQGWMCALAKAKGLIESDEDFNCVSLELDEKDLTALETAVHDFKLPQTSGFFFGTDSYDKDKFRWLFATDILFIDKAKAALARGGKVEYSCWF